MLQQDGMYSTHLRNKAELNVAFVAEAQSGLKSEEDIIDSYSLRPYQTRPASYASTTALVPDTSVPLSQERRSNRSWNLCRGRIKSRSPQAAFSQSSNSSSLLSVTLSLFKFCELLTVLIYAISD